MTSTLLGYTAAPVCRLHLGPYAGYAEETLPLTPFGTGITFSHSSQGLGLLLLGYPDKLLYLLSLFR